MSDLLSGTVWLYYGFWFTVECLSDHSVMYCNSNIEGLKLYINSKNTYVNLESFCELFSLVDCYAIDYIAQIWVITHKMIL